MAPGSSQPTPSHHYSKREHDSETNGNLSEDASQSQRNGSSKAVFELGEHPIDESPDLKVGFSEDHLQVQ